MNDIRLLVGSLSNDLYRVASLGQRGATAGALRFLKEAKRWSKPLETSNTASYIKEIAAEISAKECQTISEAQAERFLMQSILLQNYAKHKLK